MDNVMRYIDAGKSEGAKLIAGGERADIGTGKGYFVKPTIFDDVDPNMRIAREEIFGPVLATIRFKDADDALAKANATVYGLAAAVWTKDVSKPERCGSTRTISTTRRFRSADSRSRASAAIRAATRWRSTRRRRASGSICSLPPNAVLEGMGVAVRRAGYL
jgi:hypothetical protein